MSDNDLFPSVVVVRIFPIGTFFVCHGFAARGSSPVPLSISLRAWLFPNAGFGFVAPNIGLLFVGAGISGIYFFL